jgi:acyl-CoA thioesterase-1
MMGSDMDDDVVRGSGPVSGPPVGNALNRRQWLAHCSVLATLACATLHAPAWAAGSGPPARQSVLVVGDSLSAEYGLKRGSGWVALLQARLAQGPRPTTVVNASISGDTTSGGRSRLAQLLTLHKPTIVIIELGGNDALRGLPLAMTRSNLSAMVQAAKAAGARVVVVGMQVPPNYGRQYGNDFAGLFATVAKTEGVALVPFLLDGIANGPQADAMFQADRIHPLASAHPRMLTNVWRVLEPLLR